MLFAVVLLQSSLLLDCSNNINQSFLLIPENVSKKLSKSISYICLDPHGVHVVIVFAVALLQPLKLIPENDSIFIDSRKCNILNFTYRPT